MSVTLALITLGRSISLGNVATARSNFSFTSIKMMSTLLFGSKSIYIAPASARASAVIFFNPVT